MNWLPTDIVSFIWGVVVASGVAIATGLLQEIGKDIWGVLKPKPPEDQLVDLKFEPKLYHQEDCRWVNEESVSRYAETHFFYPHPKTKGRCYRKDSHRKRYLMVKNGAEQQS